MNKTKLALYSILGVSCCLSIVGIGMSLNTPKMNSSLPNHAIDALEGISLPVISTQDTIGKPFNEDEINVVESFYDYQASDEEQRESLIYFEDTYIQSKGIGYKGKEEFDVISILDGEVISVEEDVLYGNRVTIKNTSSITSIYESIKDIQVKEGDTVSKGTIIGKSGESNINKDLGNHLYFELIINGISVNPEEYYEKEI